MIEVHGENDNHRLMELVTSGYFDQFTKPVTSTVDEQAAIDQFAISTPARYNTALVIGRFQPLHRGHLHLFNHALAVSKEIIIGIGSANLRNRNNPFSPEHRERMLRRALEAEGIGSRVHRIVRINDYEDDNMWVSEVLNRTGRNIGVVVGNNDWVNGIFEQTGYKTLEIPLLKRDILSGTKIREDYLYRPGILQEPI
ncbi:MAG: adenylyltransferase/cytidyltransferase family protein [Candidatus Levyibacteriota bacterium]